MFVINKLPTILKRNFVMNRRSCCPTPTSGRTTCPTARPPTTPSITTTLKAGARLATAMSASNTITTAPTACREAAVEEGRPATAPFTTNRPPTRSDTPPTTGGPVVFSRDHRRPTIRPTTTSCPASGSTAGRSLGCT